MRGLRWGQFRKYRLVFRPSVPLLLPLRASYSLAVSCVCQERTNSTCKQMEKQFRLTWEMQRAMHAYQLSWSSPAELDRAEPAFARFAELVDRFVHSGLGALPQVVALSVEQDQTTPGSKTVGNYLLILLRGAKLL